MLKSSLRILYLTSSWPDDKGFGGQLRAWHIGRALQTLGQVTVVVVSSDEPRSEWMERTAEAFQVELPVRVHPHPHRGLVQRLNWLINPRYLNVHGCVAASEDRNRLLRQLKDFDLVWVQNSRTPNILNQWSWPRSVLDLDDVPSTFQRSIWRNASGLKEKFKSGIHMRLQQRREQFWPKRFSVLSVCSEADRQYLGGGAHLHVIPNGFERPKQPPLRQPATPPRLGFIGLYDYPPNREGMAWFIRSCWDQIKRQIPDARLRLIGKGTDGPLKPSAPDLDALGYVADPAAEIATWSAMIVPVMQGAGTRVKIADGFSRKCPVISTRLGAFGYEVEHGRELLLADQPAEFANACVSMARDQAAGVAMAERAYAAFLKKWTWDAIAPRVCAAAEDCLRRSQDEATEQESK
jgi:glycosyltransferase involved in cell wall biosynthesis